MLSRCLPVCGLLLAAAVFPLLAAEPGPATAEWPQWRGPNRNGVSPDTGLLKQWPKGGPKLLWEAKGAGKGYSSLSISGGRIFTCGDGPSTAGDKDEYVLAFDQATGNQLWKKRLSTPWDKGQTNWQGARSTPTVDGDLVYALSATGELVCLEAATGNERWRKSYPKDFNGKKGEGWGYSESVLIDGNKLIGTPGGATGAVVALDKKTGELLWKTPVPGSLGAGHASVVISEACGIRQYVQLLAGGVVGIAAADGTLLWHYDKLGHNTANIPTPIVRGDYVFCAAGYGKGGALLKLSAAGGGVKAEEVYYNPKLKNKHGGIVLVGDYLYGDSDDGGQPWCADFLTGKQEWKARGSGTGSMAVTAADGYLYCRFANGQLALVPATHEGYKEVSAFKIPHSGDMPSWSHPVIIGGKLYLREQNWLLCYDLKEG